MNYNGLDLTMLAQMTYEPVNPENSQDLSPSLQRLMDFDELWLRLDTVSSIQALGAITIAVIFILYGWRLFRLLVALNFLYLGMYLGRYAGSQSNQPNIILLCGVLGAIFCLSMTYPFMKYCVAILGGMAGAAIGGALWKGFAGMDNLILAGALAGMVAGAFLAFSSFKYTVMMFTSVQGSTMLIVGIMAILKNQTPFASVMKQYLIDMPMNLPALLLCSVIMGIFIQKKMLSTENSWKMPADEGWKRN